MSNQIIGVLPSGTALREFDIVMCANGTVQNGTAGTPNTAANLCPGSAAVSKQSPYAEIDYKTSGGHDSYNALQLARAHTFEEVATTWNVVAKAADAT